MTFYIAGSTKGLGKYLCKRFDCTSIDRPTDLLTDIDEVVELFNEGDCVILNAHANQLEYVEKLKDKCSLVIMGSLAAVYPDQLMPDYSADKLVLEKTIQEYAIHSKFPMLYLRLTSSSYRDYVLIGNSIQFWLDNQDVTFIGYNINE
jgi:hypothetical protein